MASTVEAGANRMTDDTPSSPLETGWWPMTPAGDTYLRRFLLNWAGMSAAMARTLGGRSRDLPAVLMADSGRPLVFFNCATLMQPLPTEATSATLAEITEFFAFADPSGQGEVLLVSAWPTADLRPVGWNLMGHPPLHLLPAGAVPRSAPPDLEVKEVRAIQARHAWERVAIEGYPLDALAGAPPGSITSERWLEEPRLRLWVGCVGNRPLSASSAWTEHGINNVTLVATVPDARGRGYGEALTWHAARADPSLPAMLLSSDDGRSIYERMGFLPLQRLTLWYRPRPG
jgi:GNAT superfamily N-acetyltransferase